MPRKLFIQALTKCDKIPFIKGVKKLGQFSLWFDFLYVLNL